MGARWNSLPEELYVKIFGELSYEDRLQAALVCKHWNTCFKSPRLWYNVNVNFEKTVDGRLKKLALRYGEYFRRVHVQCHQQNQNNCDNVCQFIEILYRKEKLKIEEFKLQYCEQNPLFYSGKILLDHLTVFFSVTSSHITKIDFSKFPVAFNDDFLKVISERHGAHIQYLNIQNNTLIYRISKPCLVDFLKAAVNLKQLYVQSSCFSDEALKVFSHRNREKLQFLSLLFTRADKFFKSIASEDWQEIREALPNLRIELFFDHTYPLDATYKIMLPEVPVSVLKLCLQATVTEHINLAASLYKDTLETLVVTSTPSKDLDDAVLRIVRDCALLQDIHIWCRLARDVVKEIHQVKPLRKYTLAFIE